jgi:branched-chain amino acid transport system substrate-binding protein
MLVLSACGGDGGGKNLKVAILAPLSGDVATFGQSTRDGAMLAIEEWNEKGGVLGKEIEVVVEDSQCSADAAVSAANKVIDQDGAKFIIGEVCSSASIPVSEIAVNKNIFQISPTSTNPQVTIDEDGVAKPTVFRACFTDDWQGGSAAKYALENLDAKTAAVLVDQGNDYVLGLGEFFREAFEAAGGEVVVWETYTGEDQDFSAILTKVKDADPDILYLPDYYSTVNLIAAQANEKGIEATMMGGDGWDSPDLDEAAVDGGYFSNHYSPSDPRPIVQDFVGKYEEKYGSTPDALATLAYDAANILFKAIEEADSTDPVKVAEAMETMEFEVVSGRISYDAQHNPVKAAFILHVTGGEVALDTTLYPDR